MYRRGAENAEIERIVSFVFLCVLRDLRAFVVKRPEISVRTETVIPADPLRLFNTKARRARRKIKETVGFFCGRSLRPLRLCGEKGKS